MMRINRAAWLVAAVLVGLGAPMARAGVVTFTFDASDNNLSTITRTEQGITLSLFNSTGSSLFQADGNGLYVTSYGTDLSTGFNLSVTGGTIDLTGYNVGYVKYGLGSSAMNMAGTSGSSTGNTMTSVGAKTANGNVQLAPGTNGGMWFTGFSGGGDFSQLKSLTFNFTPTAAVPEPGTVGLALMGAGALGLRAWRRRGLRAAA